MPCSIKPSTISDHLQPMMSSTIRAADRGVGAATFLFFSGIIDLHH
jgi:hypothetical protein